MIGKTLLRYLQPSTTILLTRIAAPQLEHLRAGEHGLERHLA